MLHHEVAGSEPASVQRPAVLRPTILLSRRLSRSTTLRRTGLHLDVSTVIDPFLPQTAVVTGVTSDRLMVAERSMYSGECKGGRDVVGIAQRLQSVSRQATLAAEFDGLPPGPYTLARIALDQLSRDPYGGAHGRAPLLLTRPG